VINLFSSLCAPPKQNGKAPCLQSGKTEKKHAGLQMASTKQGKSRRTKKEIKKSSSINITGQPMS
jgi:hypothetical protein